MRLGTALDDRTCADGQHVVLADPAGEHRLWFVQPAMHLPLAVVIPLDKDFAFRVAGAQRFRRWLEHRASGQPPRSMLLTKRHRDRLVSMLRALDMHRAEHSYREIAATLFGEKAASERGWKTLPLRGQTIRLVQDANAIVNGGYLKLLRGN